MSTREPVNILLVDDQPAKLLTYEVILRDLGENLLKASSATEALEYLLKKEIAVILIDVVMPDLDGFELAAMIRSHPRFRQTAMIFVSAIALTDLDRVKGYEHGAVDYVPVPIVPELLRAKVRVFAELFSKTRQLEILNAELERRVEERTAELAQTNAELERRVEERTRERETALAQVHEMQKLESLGKLTGGLAHDFNNLLMTIMSNLDLLSKRFQTDSKVKRLVDGAMQSAERGATLTKRMLAFARRQELRPEPVDIGYLINGMAEMLQRTLGPTIEITMGFRDDLDRVLADPNQLELAILNLALNARDAMPDGGRLTITARHEGGELGPNAESGDYAVLTVSDTGIGMDENTLKRATEPFFTTKEVGKGTGLGLSMVHGLTAQSGGSMHISSRPGSGTTVELWLPIAKGSKVSEVSPKMQSEANAKKSYCVLVVDDDPLVAEATANMVDDLGHPVRSALSGAQALERIREDASINVVITDFAMPGMNGMELAAQIRRMKPDLPIVLVTGYAELQNASHAKMVRLTKPYRQEELAKVLATLLEPGIAANVVSINSARRDAG
jgi:signal transduction histidine kinase